MRTIGATAGIGREGVVGGRFAWEVAHLAFDRAGILARAPWGQPLGAEFVQEVVAKKGNASGQVR